MSTSPSGDTSCSTGVGIVYAPVVPGQYINDSTFPLVGSARRIQRQLPSWFIKTPCSNFSKLLNILGGELDLLSEHIDNISNKLSYTTNINEFRLYYETDIPYFHKGTYSNLECFYISPYTNTEKPLYKVKSLVELMSTKGPSYFIDEVNNRVLFSNLERRTLASTGIASGSQYIYPFNIDLLVDDKTILSINTGWETSPARRWDEISLDTLRASSGRYYSIYPDLIFSVSYLPPSSGIRIRWQRDDDLSLHQVAVNRDYSNSWDDLGNYVGLSRIRQEGNYAFRKRILSAYLFEEDEGKRTSILDISRELNLIDFEVWDGSQNINIGARHPDFTNIYISNLPEKEVNRIRLIRHPSSGNVFTSPHRDWEDGAVIYVNGIYWSRQWSQDSNGLIYINCPENSVVEAQYTYSNYSISGGTVIPSSNLKHGFYIIAVVSGLDINSLMDLKDSIFSRGKPTLFGKHIFKELEKMVAVGYGKVRWNSLTGRFFPSVRESTYREKMALSFED
jgi:hypothetical protein